MPVFCSYADEDSAFAARIAQDLEQAGAQVWRYQSEVQPGQRWDREVERALDQCSDVLVVVSRAGMNSDHVMNEVAYAQEGRKRIIPVVVEPCRLPLRMCSLTYIDFTRDYSLAFDKLRQTTVGRVDLEEIARQFHDGLKKPIQAMRPLVFKPRDAQV